MSYDKLPSKFTFNYNVRRYSEEKSMQKVHDDAVKKIGELVTAKVRRCSLTPVFASTE
jgi:hypothetical protein